MENTINGLTLNQKVIKHLKSKKEMMYREAKFYSENVDFIDQVEKTADENFVKKEQIEQHKYLVLLEQYLSFDKEDPANVYEFKGFKYNKSPGDEVKTTIFLKKEHALNISRFADKFEQLLGVRLPAELYLLKYKDDNMPGLDYKAPEPKVAKDKPEEHEQKLERHYEAHGVHKTPDTATDFRQAYPHEKINGRNGTAEMTDVPQDGYFTTTAEEHSKAKLNAGVGPEGLGRGQKSRVTGTDKDLGRRIGKGILDTKNFLTDKENHKTALKALAVVGIGAGVISLFATKPILAVAIAAGAGGGYLISKFGLPLGSKLYKSVKKKLGEWLFGPELQKPPSETPEQIAEKLSKLQEEEYVKTEEIRIYQEQIDFLKAQIARLPKDDPKVEQYTKEIQAREQAIKANTTRLAEIKKDVAAMLFKHDNELSGGGRTK